MENMASHHTALIDVLIILSVSLAVVAIFRRLNLSSLLGYLVVGAVIGAHGLNLISNSDSAKYLAEFGVVFLLFAIGLELTFGRLMQMRKQVFGFGTLQVLISASILGSITYVLSNDINIAFVAGFVFALSSTAIVLQVLSDRGEEVAQHGRLSISTLILQDLAFVPMLIVIPLLADGDSGILKAVLYSIGQGALALFIVVILGRKFVGPLYRGIAMIKSQELFIALTLLLVLGAALLTEHYGMSLALGAFVAGLLVAETEYRTQVETDLKPFKGLLMGLFFITVGMKIDYQVIVKEFLIITILTVSIIVIKSLVVFYLARAFGFGKSCSLKAGLTLSQASEFAFVLFGIALIHNIITGDLAQIFTATVAISMALTPFLAMLADYLSKKLYKRNPVHFETSDIESEVCDISNHIIVVGYDKVGKTTCDLLKYKSQKFLVLDDSPAEVHKARKEGMPIFFGACNNLENIENLGLDRARMVVVTLADRDKVTFIAKAIKKAYPKIKVIVRARDRIHARELKGEGVDLSIAEQFESSLMIGNFILTSLGVKDSEIEEAVDTFRKREHPDSQIKGVLYKAKEDFSSI
jgi:CPA2 family monovalent cation:H+ antiporter-2